MAVQSEHCFAKRTTNIVTPAEPKESVCASDYGRRCVAWYHATCESLCSACGEACGTSAGLGITGEGGTKEPDGPVSSCVLSFYLPILLANNVGRAPSFCLNVLLAPRLNQMVMMLTAQLFLKMQSGVSVKQAQPILASQSAK